LDCLDYIMDPCSALLSRVVQSVALDDFMETAHNCSLDQTYTPIHIVVFDPWD
jgi:hypothetical protein